MIFSLHILSRFRSPFLERIRRILVGDLSEGKRRPTFTRLLGCVRRVGELPSLELSVKGGTGVFFSFCFSAAVVVTVKRPIVTVLFANND